MVEDGLYARRGVGCRGGSGVGRDVILREPRVGVALIAIEREAGTTRLLADGQYHNIAIGGGGHEVL